MTARALALAALLALPLSAAAQWAAGTHYEVLPEPPARPDGRIEVVEAFWYGCPSCFNLEPHIKRWLATKPDDVQFTRVAASLNPGWRVHARAFYTADALGVVDKVHDALFNALHLQRDPLNTVDSIAAVFAEHAGTDPTEFRTAFGSFGVDARMRRGDQLVRRHRLNGVPAVIVNGRYLTDPGRARGFENVMQVVDHLIELERRAMASQPATR